jgi:hypothetical protein
LIPKRDETGVLVCPECGIPYSEKLCVVHLEVSLIKRDGTLYCVESDKSYSEEDTASEEKITGKFSGQSKAQIISAKRKKKYYDKQGNEITDETFIQDIQRGVNVYYYREHS